MNLETKKWTMTGTIIKHKDWSDSYGIYSEDYWVDGEVDDNFEFILKKIGHGKQVTVTIQTCEVK